MQECRQCEKFSWYFQLPEWRKTQACGNVCCFQYKNWKTRFRKPVNQEGPKADKNILGYSKLEAYRQSGHFVKDKQGGQTLCCRWLAHILYWSASSSSHCFASTLTSCWCPWEAAVDVTMMETSTIEFWAPRLDLAQFHLSGTFVKSSSRWKINSLSLLLSLALSFYLSNI